MKHKLLLLLAMSFGMASNIWALNQVGGVYQIGTAQDLVDFAALVNGGTTGANAVLTANIDLDGTTWTPIGNSTNKYAGTFDGQGHAITNLSLTTASNFSGFFGYADGATIKSFTLEGSITSTHEQVGGIVGRADNITISNVHCKTNITCTKYRQGGILGAQQGNGTVNIDHCTYSGTFDAQTTSGGNRGGFVGVTFNSGSAYVNITNCLFKGEVKNVTGDFGGFVGYSRGCHLTIKNCLSYGTFTNTTTPGQFIGTLNTTSLQKYEGVNYYISGNTKGTGSATEAGTLPVQVTDLTQLTSGELCYLLNESVSGGENWFQILEDDDYPTPNGSAKVFANGSFNCNMTPKEGTELTYSNTESSTVDPHSFTDGICSNCGTPDENYMSPVDGYYMIGTPAQLKWFAAFVNAGHPDINAKLTDNINLTNVAWTPIGNASVNYTGIFDGQDNAITNFSYTATAQHAGLFGYITTATIKDFSISGTLTSNYNYTGMIGYATAAKVSGIHSSLNVTATANTWVGGIVAGANGAIEIAECTYDGALNTSNGNAVGGIMGYANTGTIRNCIFSGTLEGGGAAHFGGILGYVANAGFGGVENCLSTGTIDTSEGTFNNYAYLIGNINTNTKLTNIKNNYFEQRDNTCPGYAGAIADQAEAPIPVSSSQLESGEVCYLLNGDQSTITFYQTIGIDAYPTLDSTHSLVYVNGTVCPDTGTPQGTNVTYSNTEGTTEGSHVPADGFCIYCGTVDPSYLTANGEDFYEISNKKELVWFAALVNAGTYDAKAKLTADINMNGADISHFPIGDASATSKYYTGTFDGQGHKLSNFQLVNTSAPTNYGMFNATTGVVLKNFWLDSSCAIEGKEMVGLIGHLYGGGRLEGIGNCADVTGKQNNIGGLIGGVTGNSGSKKNITIKNCWTTGKVETTNPSASNGKDCGALTGWFNNAIISIEGFWTVADVVNPRSANTYVYRNGAGASFTISNSFSKNGEQANYTNFTDEQLANGWLCYGLNGDQSDIAWYQTIGTDSNPVLDSSREEVLYVGTAGYSTFYDADNKWALSSYNNDAKAYIGTINASNNLHLEEINVIPAGTAVILKGTYYNKVSTTANASTDGNVLLGSDGSVRGNGSTIYALAKLDDKVGFYQVDNGVVIPAGKAYLESTSGVKGFTFVFDDDDATAIEKTLSDSPLKGENIYNLAGQRLGNSQLKRGIYIVNGKKVLK